jgi:predicted nucleotidyltransferase component of viral defense system
MTLHTNQAYFEKLILQTADYKGIVEAYIEKDYWVTYALKTLFQSKIGSQSIFKGGTALVKCYNAIERFSEDIDIVVLRNEGESDNQLTNKIKAIGKAVSSVLPEAELEGITHKKGKIRKTAHPYNRLSNQTLGQVRESIILEATWLGHFEPYTTAKVQSFIADMMQQTGQDDWIKEYDLQPFEVKVLTKERTFCEKIMSLVRFSFTENPILDLNNKVRHIYDIHKLLEDKVIVDFFESNDFDKMLLRVANEDVKSFKNNNAWLVNHPTQAILFADVEKTWNQIRRTYQSFFRDLVFGQLPTDKMILETLIKVAKRLSQIEWNVIV